MEIFVCAVDAVALQDWHTGLRDCREKKKKAIVHIAERSFEIFDSTVCRMG
jgi:hypothetical protein